MQLCSTSAGKRASQEWGGVMGAAHADGVPPVQQERGLPAAMEGLPNRVPFSGGYRYVIFHFWFITITRRSLSVAIAASCLTFVALQVCRIHGSRGVVSATAVAAACSLPPPPREQCYLSSEHTAYE